MAACVAKKDNAVDTLGAASSTTSTTSGQPAASVPDTSSVGLPSIGASVAKPDSQPARPAAPAPAPTAAWTVTSSGIGPLRAGMTVAEANKAVGGGFSSPTGADPACSYAKFAQAPNGVAVMLANNKIARVEVRSGTTATADGARIGDSEAKINSLYKGQVTATPHKYISGGHYLTVTPADGSQNGIVFETDGKVVKEYRAGALPAVQLVERCG